MPNQIEMPVLLHIMTDSAVKYPFVLSLFENYYLYIMMLSAFHLYLSEAFSFYI